LPANIINGLSSISVNTVLENVDNFFTDSHCNYRLHARVFDFGTSSSSDFYKSFYASVRYFWLGILMGDFTNQQGIEWSQNETSGQPSMYNTIPINQTSVITYTYTGTGAAGTGMSIYLNQNEVNTRINNSSTGAAMTPSQVSGASNFIGKSNDNNPYMTALMQEFIVFNTNLSTADRQTLESNQTTYYGAP
jgi:hypothetical protein